MTRLLITGGTGRLGRIVVRHATAAGHDVRVLSRAPATGEHFVRGDLATGEGLQDALDGADLVIHAASDARHAQAVDVEGTRHLAEAARRGTVRHLVYVSIVGSDAIPYPYYQRKREAEQIVEAGGIPFTILRATQFHSFVYAILTVPGRIPALKRVPARFKCQSVAEGEVAWRLVQCVADGPSGGVVHFGGPEILSLEEMARPLQSRGVSEPLVSVPLPGIVARAFFDGKNTTPDGERGLQRWSEWLAERDRADGD